MDPQLPGITQDEPNPTPPIWGFQGGVLAECSVLFARVLRSVCDRDGTAEALSSPVAAAGAGASPSAAAGASPVAAARGLASFSLRALALVDIHDEASLRLRSLEAGRAAGLTRSRYSSIMNHVLHVCVPGFALDYLGMCQRMGGGLKLIIPSGGGDPTPRTLRKFETREVFRLYHPARGGMGS